MIPDFNYAFKERNYNKPQTIDQNKIIMQIKKDQCLMPYGVNNTEMRKRIKHKSRNRTSEY